MRRVLIAKAWPYANGPLHFGHMAGLLPADVLARYFRLRGDNVLFVSGTDCHGTPIVNRAVEEGKTPEEIASYYHDEFVHCFTALGFTHDLYGRTAHPQHHEVARRIFSDLYAKGFLLPKDTVQLYCPRCERFLVDRYVEGTCPFCEKGGARGDQCDQCGKTYEATALVNPTCKSCNGAAQKRHTEHLFLRLPLFQKQLEEWVARARSLWHQNAQQTTEAWLERGLEDRAVTRDIEWGIPVPVPGWEEKCMYVWFEAVIGYLSASIRHCGGSFDSGLWEAWWRPENHPLQYYVHGKDNIPFHTIVFPAMLMGLGNFALPTHIVSSEYLQLPEGQKFSKSSHYGATVPEFLELVTSVPGLEVDSLRHFLTANCPETRDAAFSWTALAEQHNAALVHKLGNAASRVCALIRKHFAGGAVPDHGTLTADDEQFLQCLRDSFSAVGGALEAGEIRKASGAWVSAVDALNVYLAKQEPWRVVKTDRDAAGRTLWIGFTALANIATLVEPFIPSAALRLRSMLGTESLVRRWEFIPAPEGLHLGEHESPHLFSVIDREKLPAD